ncbi:MAG TPA: MBL fold metallo-hydrolase [Devosiaceae bacterium]|nr:MBL fold metallo-hydrolase [Devosiaceae bacterium]
MTNRQATLTLIGGPTLLIEIGGFRFLTDPTFDPEGSEFPGGVTLRKTTGPALRPDEIGPLDAVLLSHDQHADNLDRSGRELLPSAKATLTTPVGASRLGGNARGLAPWETAELTGSGGSKVFVTATPARHGPVGIEPIAGDVTGFAIGLEAPGDAIYISGDTVWYEGVAEVAQRFRPRLVVMFAGSAETRGRFHLTMDSNDAIATASAFPEAKIIAIHNEGWEHFKESAADLAQSFAALRLADRLVAMEKGKFVVLEV